MGGPKIRNMICHQALLLTDGVEAIAGITGTYAK
jgi:hypothetical protein